MRLTSVLHFSTTEMASMAFSTTFFTPLRDFNQPRTNSTPSTSLPFTKSSIASSNSPFFQLGFSQQASSNFPIVPSKTRSFSVNAKAIKDKTIYDFTVKVCISSISISILVLCEYWSRKSVSFVQEGNLF